MGEFIKAEFAWMIPTDNGVVLEDNPNAPGMKPIYRVPVDEAQAFRDKWLPYGVDFRPLYSGVIIQPAPVVNTIRKKNERSK